MRSTIPVELQSIPFRIRNRRTPGYPGSSNLFVIAVRTRSGQCFLQVHVEQAVMRSAAPWNSLGNPMARDSRAALVALNRFGGLARGSTQSNDLVVASIRATLSKPTEPRRAAGVPGVDPGAGRSGVRPRAEVKQARGGGEIRTGVRASTPPAPPAPTRPQSRSTRL